MPLSGTHSFWCSADRGVPPLTRVIRKMREGNKKRRCSGDERDPAMENHIMDVQSMPTCAAFPQQL